MSSVVIRAVASTKKKGMTLAELQAFVTEARELQIPPDARVRVGIGWSAQIEWLQVPR